ncbi:MAG: hypothetical protein PPP58_11600 [Natronomonas sp.]
MTSKDSGIAGFGSTDRGSDSMVGIVFDGVIGAVSGAVGMAAMTVVLLVGSTVGGFEMTSLSLIVELTGLAGAVPVDPVAAGYLLFLAGGMVTWPLFFAAIGRYLPGETYARKGAFFGFILWTGFVLAFYIGYTGLEVVLYVLFTLTGHLVYGFSLGAVFDYLSSRDETLV